MQSGRLLAPFRADMPFYAEIGGKTFLQNSSNNLTDYVIYPGRQFS
jgi:hypothetical protein